MKAPLKNLVDDIVDELARDARVSAAYDLWYQLREEVLRAYRDDLPERLPLSRQKEFKQIRNLVIREAAQLGETAERAFPGPDAVQSAARLLHHMGRIFQERTPGPPVQRPTIVDKKLRRRIWEKKVAMGHKPDDHENEEIRSQ